MAGANSAIATTELSSARFSRPATARNSGMSSRGPASVVSPTWPTAASACAPMIRATTIP